MLFTHHRELTRDTTKTIRGRLTKPLRSTYSGILERRDPVLNLTGATLIRGGSESCGISQTKEKESSSGRCEGWKASALRHRDSPTKTPRCLLKPHFRGAVLSCDTISRLNYSAADWLSFSLLNPQLQRTVTMVNMRAVGTSSGT